MECTIRRAKFNDFTAVSNLLFKLNNLHVCHLPMHFQQPDQDMLESMDFEKMLQSNEFIWAVAESNEQTIGFIKMDLRLTTDAPGIIQRLYAGIESIFVEPEHRNQGVGRKLMHFAENEAKQLGADEVCLNVYSFNNSALAFYQKLGYAQTSIRMTKSVL